MIKNKRNKGIEEAMREYDAGNWQTSINKLQEAKKRGISPSLEAEIDAYIGWNLWKMQQKREAAKIWTLVLSTGTDADDTTKASAHAGLGIYYAEKVNKKKALEHAQLAQDLLPADATINQVMNLNACGIVMAKIGELEQAENTIKKVARINERLEKSDDPKIARKAKHQRAKNGYNLASLVYIPRRMWNIAIKELKNRVVPRYAEVGAKTDLAAAYHRISEGYENIGDCGNALHFEEMSLNIWKEHQKDAPGRIEMAQKNIERIEGKTRE